MLFQSCALWVLRSHRVFSILGRELRLGLAPGPISAALMGCHQTAADSLLRPPGAQHPALALPASVPRTHLAAGTSPWPSLPSSCVQGLILPEVLGSDSPAAAFPEPSLIAGEDDLSILRTSHTSVQLHHHASERSCVYRLPYERTDQP